MWILAYLLFSCGELDSANTQATNEHQMGENSDDLILNLDSVGSAAKLTSEQINQLLSIQQKQFKVIVPTYIPSGFKVEKFNANKNPAKNHNTYEIVYRNPNGLCFKVSGKSYPYGGDPGIYETIDFTSPLFGKKDIHYFDSDQESDFQVITLAAIPPGRFEETRFEFTSTSNTSYMAPNCSKQLISLQTVKEILKSLQYLKP
jgi:hypothetical protein